MKMNRFIMNTRYGTLKNDTQTNTISATIPSGQTWDPNTSVTLASATVDVGTINAGLRAKGKSTKYATEVVGVSMTSIIVYGIPSLGITGITGNLYCNLERTSATTVKLSLAVDASPGAPNFRTEEAQTITFVFSTFLSPFD